ncbi:MAG: hypothetical protein M0016_03305 [Deltaproteobacteria bacterium]|jgi:hypothetical protein|nr:hypothetical protein [Deltaproteobacteria bacterium]MCL5879746.1 hypothetical protein [Deltaproteobacteria bacterium]MDA8304175.1 hypothetical protein [Deltaproteobacteria bacterium]
MESKIRIKMGQIEIDFEGSEGFLKEGLIEYHTPKRRVQFLGSITLINNIYLRF